jgi:Na+/pantothenate symporter
MPARGVIISGALDHRHIVFTSLALRMYAAYGFGRLAEVTNIVRGWVSFFIGSAFYYHTIRQLILVNRTVRMVRQFDLFQLEPVYAFSALTSRTAVAWVILISSTLFTAPIQAAPFPTLALLVVQLALGIAAFVLPLRTVNSHLVGEKRRLLAELDLRVKKTLASLHRCFDDNALVR